MALARLVALFMVVSLIILGLLLKDINSAQNEHFSSGKMERTLIIKQDNEILHLLEVRR